LLVARNDDLDAGPVERIEQRIDLDAGHAEDRRHSVRACGLHDRGAARQPSLFKWHEITYLTY